jgi:hypothetical protein
LSLGLDVDGDAEVCGAAMLASTVARGIGADRALDPSDLDEALQRLGVLETERALAAWLWSIVRSATVHQRHHRRTRDASTSEAVDRAAIFVPSSRQAAAA